MEVQSYIAACDEAIMQSGARRDLLFKVEEYEVYAYTLESLTTLPMPSPFRKALNTILADYFE